MFILSKLLSAITQPLFWLALWWVCAVCFMGRKPKTARRMLWAGIAAFGALGIQAIPDALLRPLENRYAVPVPQDVAGHAGVIVLGGAFALDATQVWHARGQISLGNAAERMSAPVGWMRTHAHWQLVFTGGEGRLVRTGVTEGELAQQFYQEQGVDMSRVTIEQGARTTRENAQLVQQTLGSRCSNERWLLVTSAWHMPRAVPEFEAVGCQVTPYPVDFRTGAHTSWREYHMADSLMRWQVALHEWLGMLAYALTRPR